MADWEISRRSGRCAVSGCPLEEGEEYYAVLFDRGDYFERADYSLPHWTGPPDDTFSYWKAHVPMKAEKKRRLLVDDAVLVNFFTRLAREAEASKQEFRFVLALILMRKRLLRYDKTERDGDREVWLMRLKGQDEVQRVWNPELGEEQVERVTEQLNAILHEDVAAAIGTDDEE